MQSDNNNPDHRSRPVHPLEREPVAQPQAQQQPQRQTDPHSQPQVIAQETLPGLTYVLLAINIVVFLADQVLGGQLTRLGMKSNLEIQAGEYWRLITPMFLHGGIIHLGFNSYFLFRIGPTLERMFGTPRYAAIYFLSGLGASLLSFVLNPSPAIGASGALFGIFAAWIPMLYRNKAVMRNTERYIRSIAQVLGINLLIGLSPGIDNWAHIGGLITGLALGWLASPLFGLQQLDATTVKIEDRSEPGTVWFSISLVAVVLGAITFGLIWLL